MTQTIALLGGSFNPAHEGHLHISVEALKRCGADEVWWLVSPGNPHKDADSLMSYEERFASAVEMTQQYPQIKVKDLERQWGVRYTYDTLVALKQRYKKPRFFWMMGADNLASFHKWDRWREITNLMPILVCDRLPFSHAALHSKMAISLATNRLREDELGCIAQYNAPVWGYFFLKPHPASATEIRKRLGK